MYTFVILTLILQYKFEIKMVGKHCQSSFMGISGISLQIVVSELISVFGGSSHESHCSRWLRLIRDISKTTSSLSAT